jgi:hypothetical protein
MVAVGDNLRKCDSTATTECIKKSYFKFQHTFEFPDVEKYS